MDWNHDEFLWRHHLLAIHRESDSYISTTQGITTDNNTTFSISTAFTTRVPPLPSPQPSPRSSHACPMLDKTPNVCQEVLVSGLYSPLPPSSPRPSPPFTPKESHALFLWRDLLLAGEAKLHIEDRIDQIRFSKVGSIIFLTKADHRASRRVPLCSSSFFPSPLLFFMFSLHLPS